MSGESLLVEADVLDRALDDPRYRSAGERTGADTPVSIDFAEHRPRRDRGRGQPGVEGLDRPECFPVRHRQVGALAFRLRSDNYTRNSRLKFLTHHHVQYACIVEHRSFFHVPKLSVKLACRELRC